MQTHCKEIPKLKTVLKKKNQKQKKISDTRIELLITTKEGS